MRVDCLHGQVVYVLSRGCDVLVLLLKVVKWFELFDVAVVCVMYWDVFMVVWYVGGLVGVVGFLDVVRVAGHTLVSFLFVLVLDFVLDGVAQLIVGGYFVGVLMVCCVLCAYLVALGEGDDDVSWFGFVCCVVYDVWDDESFELLVLCFVELVCEVGVFFLFLFVLSICVMVHVFLGEFVVVDFVIAEFRMVVAVMGSVRLLYVDVVLVVMCGCEVDVFVLR